MEQPPKKAATSTDDIARCIVRNDSLYLPLGFGREQQLAQLIASEGPKPGHQSCHRTRHAG
jgi:hypothetical protein